ncbi:short-chain dehydrogenase [Ilyomonas limi]|uniref:Short-chain dehydrogenase n=1 Tax=Ilyomonas limi TaxID=2575867 RepID=A0A4U3KWB2_9BACT|nr:short-chain dehydrogenase [Ilyomonas limi]TKK66662.1 short-chain dehydrogenase [Ilyomonas limi]
MTNEQIEQFLTSKTLSKVIDINFKKRNAIRGMFVNTSDFEDLKSKNLWRIITEARIEDWKKTKDMGLSRIYNGSDFTRLKAE